MHQFEQRLTIGENDPQNPSTDNGYLGAVLAKVAAGAAVTLDGATEGTRTAVMATEKIANHPFHGIRVLLGGYSDDAGNPYGYVIGATSCPQPHAGYTTAVKRVHLTEGPQRVAFDWLSAVRDEVVLPPEQHCEPLLDALRAFGVQVVVTTPKSTYGVAS